MPLTDDRVARFARQLLVPGFGEAAQQRLADARVRAVGVDGLASGALVYLVEAGIGTLWLDDAESVAPFDAPGWVFGAGAVGMPRVEVARAALAGLSRYTAVEVYPTGGVPTAVLVAAPSTAQVLASAEAARRAGVPHVVLEADADGGAVVTITPGAPCYACARSTAGAGRPPTPGGAALAALAATELLHLVALPGAVPGRRLELVRGVVTARATVRRPGCVCAPQAPGATAPEAGAPPAGAA